MALREKYPKPHPKVIEGWKRKKYSQLPEISGYVPFVKLYSIFDGDEREIYETRFANLQESSDLQGEGAIQSYVPPGFLQSFNRSMPLSLGSTESLSTSKLKTLNNILTSSDNGGLNIIDLNPTQNQGIENNWDGGFGIKDFNCSRLSDTPLTETFSMTIQLNDPMLLKNKYEYNKLVTIGSFFLVLYGWSTNGAANLIQDGKMVLDLSEEGYINDGYWRWAAIQLHKFDINFNKMGQMEGTLDFIACQNSDMLFNMGGKMGRIGKAVQYFMNSRLLGGPAAAGSYIDNINLFDPEEDNSPDNIDASSFAILGSGESGVDTTSESDADKTKRRRSYQSTLLAMTGFYGNVAIFANIVKARGVENMTGYRISRWKKLTMLSGEEFVIDNNQVISLSQGIEAARDKAWLLAHGGIGISRRRRQAQSATIAAGVQSNTLPVGDLHSPMKFVGHYIEGRGFVPSSFFRGLPKDGDRGQTWLMENSVNLFIPILVDENNNFKAQDKSRTFENGRYNFRILRSVADQVSPEALAGALQTERLSSRKYDDLFIGKSIFNELTFLNSPATYTKDLIEIMRKMPEGVIISKLTNKEYPTVSIDPQTSTIRQSAAKKKKVETEDIVFYYLGWLLEGFKYYHELYGGKKFQIKHSMLPRDVQSVALPKFKQAIRTSVAGLYNSLQDEGDEGQSAYLPGQVRRAQDLGAAILNKDKGVQKYIVVDDDIISSTEVTKSRAANSQKFWADNDGKGGLYYKDLLELGYYNVVDPSNASFWQSGTDTPPNINDAGPGVKNTDGVKIPSNTSGKWGGIIRTRIDGEDDIFIPKGSNIPLMILSSADDNERVDELSVFGSIGSETIENTCQIPIDAAKADDILSSAEGKGFGDIMNEILTNAVAIPDINLTLIPTNDGFVSIRALGPQATEESQFAADLKPDELTYISEGNNFIIDYRTKNSLVQEITVNSKMDPNIAFMYGASVRATKNKKSIVDIINKAIPGNPNLESFSKFASGWLRKNASQNSQSTNISNLQALDSFSLSENAVVDPDVSNIIENLPDDLLSAYLSQDYKLYEQVNVINMLESNYVNQMFSYYMNQLSVKIHGTTGIECMQTIQLKNVSSLIDGFYMIIGVTDSVSSSEFITELNLMLLAPAAALISQAPTLDEVVSTPAPEESTSKLPPLPPTIEEEEKIIYTDPDGETISEDEWVELIRFNNSIDE